MAVFEQQSIRLLLSLTLLCIISQQSTQSCLDDDLYIIRSTAPNGLVLDASDPKQVTIQHFTGFRPQLWKLERNIMSANLVHIVNNYTGQVLDFAKRGDNLDVVTSDYKSLPRQLWNLTLKGRIANAENGKNLDVVKADFTPGNRLIVWEDNGNLAQSFVLQRKL